MKIFPILLLCIILTASPAVAGGWLIYHDGPYKGHVVDVETNQPIEGAAVVAVWYLERYGGGAGPIARFFEAKEVVTDQNGDFEIAAIKGFHWWPFSSLDKPNLIVYKPGYMSYEERIQAENIIIHLPKANTVKERMENVIYIEACAAMSTGRCIPEEKIPYILKLREKEWKDLGLLK